MDTFDFDDDPIYTETAPIGWQESFVEKIGKRRFDSILKRMHLENKTKYKMRDLAKVIIGTTDVLREDIVELLEGTRPSSISQELIEKISKYDSPELFPSKIFEEVYQALSRPFDDSMIKKTNPSSVENQVQKFVHFVISCFCYDPYWFAKKRMTVAAESHQLNQFLYYERISGFYAACEDLQVGVYLPAPGENEERQYYRVTAHLVTGEGQIGMILVPATRSMSLKTLRVTRGSPSPPGCLDLVSYVMTDMEPEIGRIGYESGLPYQPLIDEVVGKVEIEVGYSIGGTIAQWRAADNPHDLSSLWLYKSPGVPKSVWEKFNERTLLRENPLDLYIFQARGDIVDFAGEVPLGYHANDKTRVLLYELSVPGVNPHRYAFCNPDQIVFEKIEKEKIDQFLSNKSKTFIERQRKKVGRYFILPVLGFWQKYFGKKIPTRLDQLRGLRIERPSTDGKNFVIEQTTF